MSQPTDNTHSPAAMRRPELLAPAGDWECVRAAVENGADAVYFGLERFNARMRAKNFTTADLPALMEFLHRRGVRGYVTFNVLVFTNELQDAAQYLKAIIASGVDAAIVQDVGICRLIRKLSPDFPIHGSTQMTVTSPAGVEFARNLGAELVVLARENSIAEIDKIQAAQDASGKARLPLEVFVHGALCVAYSGQCLTSESLGGRSANRGECAQACRLPYDLYSDGEKVDLGDRRYLLSPQDLAGLEVLPDLVKAGVASLKIEGRLKSPEYVASITRVYRQALDRICGPSTGRADLREATLSETEAKYQLEMTFSRGLYTGWFRGINNQELAHGRFGTKRGVLLGEVKRVSGETVLVELQAPLKPGDGVVFDAGNPEIKEEGGRVYGIRPQGAASLLSFGTGDIDFQRVRPGQLLWKTNDPELDKRIRQTFSGEKVRFQRPVNLEVHGRAGSPLTLILDDLEGHVVRVDTQAVLEPARTQPLTDEKLREQLGRLGGTPFFLRDLVVELEGEVAISPGELNQARREAVAQLEALRAAPKRWQLVSDWSLTTRVPSTTPERRSPERPELIALVRSLAQLSAATSSNETRTVYCEFENPKHYREAVAHFRDAQAKGELPRDASIWVAPPRITKPGEEWILKQVRSCEADGYLVRNPDHAAFFASDRKRGDFSLNVANPLSAAYWLEHYNLERVTASYDLNIVQLEALLSSAPAAWFDLTLHQHMPMFHMEHCVFCAFLSSGKDYHDCGRPCEKHAVHLKDRTGAEFPLKADAGCRNTVFNNRAQTGAEFMDRLLALGARSFRVEFVNEDPSEVHRVLARYGSLLRGEIKGTELWRELRALNQLGVTRGQLGGRK
ncbi:MAG: U32 family peptidase [Opitutaceae bacterium]|nr:U32 family peptidase [Opitutaceae bacterium]